MGLMEFPVNLVLLVQMVPQVVKGLREKMDYLEEMETPEIVAYRERLVLLDLQAGRE